MGRGRSCSLDRRERRRLARRVARCGALLRVMSDGLLRISEASALQVVRRGSDRRRWHRHRLGLEDRPAGGRRGAVPRRSHGRGRAAATSKPPASPPGRCSGGSARAAGSPTIGLGADSIRAIVRKRAAAVDGITGRIGGHSLRVGSARELAADGASLVELQQAGGWRSPTTPAVYVQARVSHPRAGRSPALRGGAVAHGRLYRCRRHAAIMPSRLSLAINSSCEPVPLVRLQNPHRSW